MDPQKRIDKILDSVAVRVEEEVAGLLGTDFKIVDSQRKLLKKGDVFENLMGKQVCALIDVTGDVAGVGCLLVGIKDAIRLGGNLIMLPASELEEVCGRENYTEEIADSYGEIANIIAGSFSKEFEEGYPKSCRFIRKEQEVLTPAKVEINSDQPVPNQTYYQLQYSMLLEGKQLGEIVCLIPGATFGLELEAAVADDAGAEPDTAGSQADGSIQLGQVEPGGNPTQAGETAVEPKKFNYEKHKKRLDRLLAECCGRMADEVGALLGVELELMDVQNRLLSKEDFFYENVSGKQIMANMDVVGDLENKSFLFIGLKDAIQLGGTLVMLPPSELESVIAEEEFNEDLKDAYGEVANIISGVYTAIFEEQYTKKLRFIKKNLHEIQPLKVDIASDEPIPDVAYYISSMAILVEGKQLGQLQMAFPAEMLQLKAQADDKPVEDTAEPENQGAAKKGEPGAAAEGQNLGEPSGAASGAVSGKESKLNLDKHKKRVDKLLAACQDKMSEEVSALLGAEVRFANINNSITDKEDFFYEKVAGRQVVTHMDVVGEAEGGSYLVFNLKDAIRIGGVLIMLPDAELENIINDDEFSDDIQDAFGEITNIISGVYTQIFEEQYLQKLRFVKKGHEAVIPMKVDLEGDTPLPPGDYYLSNMALSLNGSAMGSVNLLVPLDLLKLRGLLDLNVSDAEGDGGGNITRKASGADDYEAPERFDADSSTPPDVLIIRDDNQEGDKIAEVLRQLNYNVKMLSFKDNVQNYLPGEVQAIYLVMREVNEQAFGLAIKISAATMVPLIAAGSNWTRSKVIKAVKYGVRDILLTPASEADVKENIQNNLMKKAA